MKGHDCKTESKEEEIFAQLEFQAKYKFKGREPTCFIMPCENPRNSNRHCSGCF